MISSPTELGNPERVATPEEAINRVIAVCLEVARARAAVNVRIPDDQEATVKAQQLAYKLYLMRYGQAVGELHVFHAQGLIGDVAFRELKQKVFNTLAPQIVGTIQLDKRPWVANGHRS